MDHLSELKQKPIWTNYVRVWNEKKQGYNKPPVNPKNLYNASPTNPEHWTDYATASGNIGKTARIYQDGALIAEQPVEGVGLVLARPLTGIDFDHVRDPETGEIQPFAKKIIDDLDSYTEISPSGTGLHILIFDEESEDLGKEFKNIEPDGSISKTGTAGIDAYNNNRYFTLTGKLYRDRPIRKTSGVLRRIIAEYNEKKRQVSGTEQPKQTFSPVDSGRVTDEAKDRMIRDALKAIPATPELSATEWLAVGSALKQLGYGCDVWEEWSANNGQNSKHVPGYTFKRWQRLQTKDEPERLILGMAKRYGWKASDTFTAAERWSYGRNQHTKEELAEYARQKASEEAKYKGTDEQFMEELNRVIEADKASQRPQGGKVQPAEVDAREASKPEPLIDKISPIGSYIDGFIAEYKDEKPRLSTGFLSLDKRLNGGLFPELYLLNAETSTGKSAISMTIAQNMARDGNAYVLYFALEMSRDEFIARGTSAISWEKTQDKTKAVTASDILYYHYDERNNAFTWLPYSRYGEYLDEYRKRYEKSLYIIERPQIRKFAESNIVSGNAIAKLTKQFREVHPDKPLVVFVDYLQILEGEDSDRKTKIDKNILDLKELCTQQKIPVFVISSVGRAGYKQGAELGNAKESGDLEYTAGIALGWDWAGVTDANKRGMTKEDIEKRKAKDRKIGNRLMNMTLLKSRNSERDTQDPLVYYPQYNYFREVDDILDAERKSNDNLLHDLLHGEVELPELQETRPSRRRRK